MHGGRCVCVFFRNELSSILHLFISSSLHLFIPPLISFHPPFSFSSLASPLLFNDPPFDELPLTTLPLKFEHLPFHNDLSFFRSLLAILHSCKRQRESTTLLIPTTYPYPILPRVLSRVLLVPTPPLTSIPTIHTHPVPDPVSHACTHDSTLFPFPDLHY